eukprot:gene7128-4046_t
MRRGALCLLLPPLLAAGGAAQEQVADVRAAAPSVVVSAPTAPRYAVHGHLWFPAMVTPLSAAAAGGRLLLSLKTDCDCAGMDIDAGMSGRDFWSGDGGATWQDVPRLGTTNEATGFVRPCMPLSGSPSITCFTRTVHSHSAVSAGADNRTAYLAAQVFAAAAGAGVRQSALFNATLSFPFPLPSYSRGRF